MINVCIPDYSKIIKHSFVFSILDTYTAVFFCQACNFSSNIQMVLPYVQITFVCLHKECDVQKCAIGNLYNFFRVALRGKGVFYIHRQITNKLLHCRNWSFYFLIFFPACWCSESEACSILCWTLWDMGRRPDTTLSLQLPLLYCCHHPALACQNSE